MIELEPAMTYRLEIAGPLEASDGSDANPRRRYWQMASAILEGPRIRAVSAMPGVDWFTPYPDGYGRPHVRLPFHTDDGALVLLEYQGLVHASPAFTQAVQNDTPTDWADQYMRMALLFDTPSPRYAWLMQSLFIARGRLTSALTIEYEVFRVG
jgi:hypothetical protein